MDKNQETNTTSIQMVKYVYQGNPVNFSINGNLTINATEMAKPFGDSKRPQFWLNLQLTQEFLAELSKARILALADLVQVKKGGANPGTWFHEDVALEFARWLSPAFAIWCNDRIKEILLSRANGESSAGKLSGQYISVTGADGNLYLYFILKAIREFLYEEAIGNTCTELRLVDKFNCARTLCREERKNLRNINVQIHS